MTASISSRNGILATTRAAQQTSREQDERAEQAVFAAVPEDERWMVMCMLFQPPRPERFTANGRKMYGHNR